MTHAIRALAFIFLLAPLACIPKSWVSTSRVKTLSSAPLDRCVALRGNGTHIIGHTTSLAKITNRWGEIQAMAGGSSATITTFLYESILINPAVNTLLGRQRNGAIALLLKSVSGFADDVMNLPEGKSLIAVGTLIGRLKGESALTLPPSEFLKSATDLQRIFANDDLRELINPEIMNALNASNSSSPADYQARIEEVKKAANSLVDLDATDSDVFFRRGLINFPHLISLISRVADFYAGYGGSQQQMAAFIDACASGTEEMTWRDLASKPTAQGTCGEHFSNMIDTWRKSKTPETKSRAADEQGSHLRNIMITSVVTSPPAIAALRQYDAAYRQGSGPVGQDAPRQLNVNFDDISFGYWVSSSFGLDPIKVWRATANDGKSTKAINLGSARTWREILEKSPREPSLGSFTEFSEGEPMAGAISLGGWADLSPVQVLKAAGCSKVIYLTRRGTETKFISAGAPFQGRRKSGLAELLGMTEASYNELYNLAAPESAFSKALAQADGVWCTDWNRFTAFEQQGIAADGWSAPLVTRDSALSQWPEADSSGAPIEGCRQ